MAWFHLGRLLTSGYRQQEQGPPDLEDVFKKMWSNLKGKKQTGGDNGPNGPHQVPPSGGESRLMNFGFGLIALVILVVLVIIWALAGIFTVQPAEQGVVLRFGKYVRTVEPGIHWIPRFIDSKYVVNVDQVNSVKLNQVMLTSGENFVKVSFAVQYKIGNLKEFLFNVQDPVNSLQQIVDSAVRQVVGTSQLDDILTVGREKISQEVLQQINKLVKKYQNGITIVGVQMQPAQPPAEVQDAFDDVIKAREDNQRLQNEAEGYANNVIPVAQGEANAMLQHANAYAKQVVLLAQGHVALFDALLPKYKLGPQVMADRLYFNTMEHVLEKSKLLLLEGGDRSGNLTLLPLNALLKQSGNTGVTEPTKPMTAIAQAEMVKTPMLSKSAAVLPAVNQQQQWLRFQEAQTNAS